MSRKYVKKMFIIPLTLNPLLLLYFVKLNILAPNPEFHQQLRGTMFPKRSPPANFLFEVSGLQIHCLREDGKQGVNRHSLIPQKLPFNHLQVHAFNGSPGTSNADLHGTALAVKTPTIKSVSHHWVQPVNMPSNVAHTRTQINKLGLGRSHGIKSNTLMLTNVVRLRSSQAQRSWWNKWIQCIKRTEDICNEISTIYAKWG